MSPAKENTFRTLKDQPLLADGFWCKFGLHRWLKYGEIQKTKFGIDDYILQERRCDHCNKAQYHVLKKW